jgi:hypothetical protein
MFAFHRWSPGTRGLTRTNSRADALRGF